MQYSIIGTGSKGNCVVIDQEVMVDCGLPFTKIKPQLYNVKYLLLTHIHTDHIKKSTLNNIKRLFPRITIIGNYETHQHYNVNIIANSGFEIETNEYTFTPFENEHNALCYGYTWTTKEGYNVIYSTDTSSLDKAPKGPYDWLFLESNYDEKKIEQARNRTKEYGYDVYLAAQNHLSTKLCKTFYFMNRRDKDSKLVELHQSRRFY